MPFGGEEEEEKEEEKVLCARFKVLFYIEIYGILTYLHIHKCGTLVTTAEFFANKTSLFFFSALARVFLSNNRRKKKGSLSLVKMW